MMRAFTLRPATGPAQPIECLSARISAGVAPEASLNLKAILIYAGECVLFGDFEPITAQSGDVVLVAPQTVCGCVSVSPVDVAIAFFNPVFIEEQLRWMRPTYELSGADARAGLMFERGQTLALHPDRTTFGALRSTLTDLMREHEQKERQPERVVRAAELVRVIASLVLDGHVRDSEDQNPCTDTVAMREEIRQVLSVMHENYTTSLRIEDLAASVWMSESALRRAFRAATGLSPRTYLHRLRLARYCGLVVKTSMPLAEAATTVGWASTAHARAEFAKAFGLSPRAYRKLAQSRFSRPGAAPVAPDSSSGG
ncbi:helix-turn-helix domain-containing protein [Microbacterium sp. NPDC056234]|uniref:AraC family transcriptional regulator n=1 Tax=Microbacterium sp. NPDC056234 TaxID=3345757 RepID=UPI0035DCC2B7